VTIYIASSGIPQDLHRLLGTLGVRFNYDKLSIVKEGRGVGVCLRFGETMLPCQPISEGLRDGVTVGLWQEIWRVTAQTHYWTRPWHEYRACRANLSELFCHDGRIIHSVFKVSARQSLYGLLQVGCIVEYSNNSSHTFASQVGAALDVRFGVLSEQYHRPSQLTWEAVAED
jgi:hypothetical protein